MNTNLTVTRGRCNALAPMNALRSALELRYQVYCLECAYLPAADYPDGIESDEHDLQAAHFYAFDAEEELAGYVRLVRADSNQHFPMQRHCNLSVAETDLPKHHQAGEISRLMVRTDYRRLRTGRGEGAIASHVDRQDGLPLRTIRRFCLQTGREMAAERGAEFTGAERDEDGEEN